MTEYGMTETTRLMNEAFADLLRTEPELAAAFAFSRDGTARQQLWGCRDGWIVGYTTQRIDGGPHDGRFAAMAYKPTGKGARTGKASEHVRVYFRGFSTRKAARARAERMYEQHNR